MMLDLSGACAGDQLGQRSTADASEWEVNNIGVTKQIEKERLDGLQRVGPAQLEQNYAYAPCCVSHSPGFLEEKGCYSMLQD